jgi:hydroxysqualene dehydroxylase
MPKRIAIIGGGWAGLACAVELASANARAVASGGAQHRLELFEAAPQFGGRARGLQWQGHAIDNGQHLTIGAYTQTTALLKTVQAPDWHTEPLRWAGVTTSAALSHEWTVPDSAWPWRLLQAALPGKSPRGWPLLWKLSVAKQLRALHESQWRLQREPVLQWLDRSNTPQGVIAHFWQPLVEGALNTPIALACAQTTATVLRDSLAGPHGATRVLQPKQNLSLDGVDPICEWLTQRNVGLHVNHRAVALGQVSSGQLIALIQTGATRHEHAFDAVVLALPHPATVALWEGSGFSDTAAISRLRMLETSAITTVWVELSSTEKTTLARLPNWFVFNRVANVPPIAQVAVRRGDVLALVISAQVTAHDRVSKETHEQALRAQLKAQLGIDIAPLAQKWITEKRATWACTPQSPIAPPEDAQGFTGVRNLFRCADDLEPGYPATIESAVRSGVRCAQSVWRMAESL